MTTTVTRQQYFTAVSQLGNMDTLYQSLTMNTNDPAWIEFWSASYITLGDALSNATQSAFGWTGSQMVALFNAAGAVPTPTPDPGNAYLDPSFAPTYQGLCAKIADTLNRQDLQYAIPDFTVLATARISRDMARVRHPLSITRAQASVTNNYASLPADFSSVYQLMDQETGVYLTYISPENSKAMIEAQTTPTPSHVYYTIIGNTLRIIPTPGAATPTDLDLWYYRSVSSLGTAATTNWVLVKYPDLYLYGSLVHSAPYLKADERIQIWEAAYQQILGDISIDAERATRSQSKLVATAKAF